MERKTGKALLRQMVLQNNITLIAMEMKRRDRLNKTASEYEVLEEN